MGAPATACYNHSGNTDELPRGIYSYAIDGFAAVLRQVAENNSCHNTTTFMGVTYMEFFAEYPYYPSFLFDNEYLGIQIEGTETTWNSSSTPSEIFVNGAKRGTRELNIDEKELKDGLLVMWAAVHGLVIMANMKGVQYDDGDWDALVERVLLNRVIP